MKITDKKSLFVRALSCVFLLFSCFYMYDFYKSLSGFIANGFREPFVMLPIILAFFLPVFCFLFFFYDFYVRAIHPVVKGIYSVFVALYAIVDLVLIFCQIELYTSNNSLGVYDALPSIIVHFPYDMIIVLFALFALQIFNLIANRPSTRVGAFFDGLKQRGMLRICIFEYLLLCVLAIVVFVFTGSAIYATFSAIGNAFYDVRYIFLLLWVMLIPLGNLVLLTVKPERMNISKRAKLLTLGIGICANVIFALLFLIFELTYPDFLIHIGKPLFLIAFSISLPIEPGIILGIMALSSLVFIIRLILVAVKKDSPTFRLKKKSGQKNPEHSKSIDLYIIAGQSNAAGYSQIDDSALVSLWDNYMIGSPNVIYRGRAEYTEKVNTPEVSTGVNCVQYWTSAKAGQGKGTSYMGAEVGMAARLSSTYYQGEKTCGIIKYAHGGTSIFDNKTGENAANGNWVSPSYASINGWSYAESTPDTKNLTGNLYRNLLEEFKDSIEALKILGYNDINIKGVFWMQGESDKSEPAEYEIALGYFINDLRDDLGRIMGEDLTGLAFIIGEISRTSGSANESIVAINEAFISKQREITDKMNNVYIIPSGQYEVNRIENGEEVNDQDAWHWASESMFRIGELVGQCILDNVLKEN